MEPELQEGSDIMSKACSPVITIGIDVAQDYCDICVLDEGEKIIHQGRYLADKYKAMAKKIVKMKPRIAILEATGGYERKIAAVLAVAGVPYRIVNPLRTRQFANSIGELGKTDAIDARMLALYAHRNKLEPGAIPDAKTLELKALLNRRRQLINLRTAEKNRLQRTAHKAMLKNIKEMIVHLDEHVDAIDRLLDESIGDDDEFRNKEKLLTSVPGVGDQTARSLLGEMPELGTLNRKEAAALAGLAPFARDSGKQRGKRSIQGGRCWVRNALYMATLSAIKHNAQIKQMYQRLVEKGKLKKVALTACMRKLLLLLNALLKKNELFV